MVERRGDSATTSTQKTRQKAIRSPIGLYIWMKISHTGGEGEVVTCDGEVGLWRRSSSHKLLTLYLPTRTCKGTHLVEIMVYVVLGLGGQSEAADWGWGDCVPPSSL
ncbi:hypothetical protein L6452_16603 [Arctium lappa]|uniref:Uncharacterized protein n=1 Tax=Arctium lappa TaxID=4217 RepID=A0ACB9C123_ARCLA|nr:hypothetical protein L6452_16603 [Arctium lappa]